MDYSIIYYKNNEILISNQDFEILNEFQWIIKKPDNYVCSKIKNKEYLLHRYIYIEILKINIQHGSVVDHINNNKLDNRRENLRIVSLSENSRNKLKLIDKSSKYYGVSFDKNTNKWTASISYNKKTIRLLYENEIDAAYQYDLFVDKYNLNTSKKNNIEKPENFKEILKKNKELESGIVKCKDKFRIYTNINKKQYSFPMVESLESAIKIKNTIENVKKKYFLIVCEIKSMFNKSKNEDGNYVFIISNKEVIIDKNLYFDMYKYNWYINKQGYVRCKEILLSRFIMNCNDKKLIVDHINGNLLDNRKCNLRYITQSQNTMNKKSLVNSSSKYIGVHYDKTKKKWISQIQVDGIKKYLGSFDNEIDAALIRDIATKKYYKEYGKLNFDKRPSWNMYFMKIAEVVKIRSNDFHKVGAVLVSMVDNRIISTGYNSLRSGMDDLNIDWTNRELINDTVIHAEMNAIIYAQSKFEDAILYTTMSPCKACLKIISSTKIKKVIYKHEYRDIKEVKKLSQLLNIELIEFENEF
jgi:deoxycytidylate deaminase